MTNRLRIVVGGYLGLLPAAGVTWDYVQYPAGFAALGHDVFYVEDTRLWPIYQPEGSDWGDCSATVSHLASVMEAFGLSDRWAYRDEPSGRCYGVSEERLREVCRSADVFVNVSCSTFPRDEYRAIPARALIDTDPMFTQVQYLSRQMFTPGTPGLRELVEAHTHHFTFGESVGRPDCLIPDCGIAWRPTRQPIRLDLWKPEEPVRDRTGSSYSTVMNWTAGKTLEHGGTTWGQKDVEFRRFFALPSRVPEIPLAVAVGQTGGAGEPFPQEEARAVGWRVLDPQACIPDCDGYQSFIAGSLGELSIAKETYVKARTGWFSCRSACYLAAARPVVTQDTGWSTHLPQGRGLFAFDTLEGAADALRKVEKDPTTHARAAREVAEEHFDSRRVLARLLREMDV